MNYFLLNIGLALVWVALTGTFGPLNLAVGFMLGYLTLRLAQGVSGASAYFSKVRQVSSFALFFLRELLTANIRVAIDVLTPGHRMQPRVLAVPLDAFTDTEITFFANALSLTPGTLSLDVSTDRRVLYIHAMYAADAEAARRAIKVGLEQRVLALTRGGEENHHDV
jgi:multicomponent Na+:H+ antiporter subunit E